MIHTTDKAKRIRTLLAMGVMLIALVSAVFYLKEMDTLANATSPLTPPVSPPSDQDPTPTGEPDPTPTTTPVPVDQDPIDLDPVPTQPAEPTPILNNGREPGATPNNTTTSTHSDNDSHSEPVCTAAIPEKSPIVVVQSRTSTSATLAWWPLDDVDNYTIRYGGEAGNPEHSVDRTGNVTNYTIHSLSPQAGYYFEVAGVNGCRVGDYSRPLYNLHYVSSRDTSTQHPIGTDISEDGRITSGEETSPEVAGEDTETSESTTVVTYSEDFIGPKPFWERILSAITGLFNRG